MKGTWKFILVFGFVTISTQVAQHVIVPHFLESSGSVVGKTFSLQSCLECTGNAEDSCCDLMSAPIVHGASESQTKVAASPPPSPPGDPRQRIVNLCKTGKLFRKPYYAEARAAFASLFAQQHVVEIRQGLGDDHDQIIDWLRRRPGFMADLFTAIDDNRDDVRQALAVFRSLWQWSPTQVEANADLAIATAVVWDRQGIVYDTAPARMRPNCRATGPLVDALGNFQYLVHHEREMHVRLRDLPWEILTYVVDHKTPLEERDWALSYARSRPSSAWYTDVPYDFDMLKNRPAKLFDREYSLANIRNYGGVCVQRADFAARVSKCVGIPSLVCNAFLHKGSPLKGHAYSSHLRVSHVAGDRVDIRVDTYIRDTVEGYYYLGQVTEPQTNNRMGDYDAERHWWVVGQDRVGKRQAALAMRSYVWLKDELRFDVPAKCAYLENCLKLSLFNDSAWLELERMARAKEFPAGPAPPFLQEHFASLTNTASRFPDFVVQRYDGLLGLCPDPGDRIHYYSYALKMCESHRRHDLVDNVRQKIAALQKQRSQ